MDTLVQDLMSLVVQHDLILTEDTDGCMNYDGEWKWDEEAEAKLGMFFLGALSRAAELHEQVWALANGWTVDRQSLYDEDGVEGWLWEDPEGNQYIEVGAWDELPPWPDEARSAVANARSEA